MKRDEMREKVAQASGGYSDEEWAKLIASGDELDKLTVRNARAIAANVLEVPEIAEALKLTPVKQGPRLGHSISTGTRKD